VLHARLGVFTDECMNTGLDHVDLPDPADALLLHGGQSGDRLTGLLDCWVAGLLGCWVAASFQRHLAKVEAETGGGSGEREGHGREFKLEAVKLAEEQGVAVARAAHDLDVHANVPCK